MKNIKPKTLLAILCTTVAFNAHAGWWDNWLVKNAGDDGNPTTVGNAAANKSETRLSNKAVDKPKLNIINETQSTLGSAVLKDEKGKILFTSKKMTCAVSSMCTIEIDNTLIKKSNTFFFYDINNKLVSAYALFDVKEGSKNINVDISISSLGVYVFNKIQHMDPSVTYNDLVSSLYDSQSQKVPFASLGDYYLDFLGNMTDDTAVIKEFTKQLSGDKPLLTNTKSQRIVKSVSVKRLSLAASNNRSLTSSTSSSFCSSTFTGAMDFTGVLLKFVPIPGLSLITDGAKFATTAGCSGSQDNYSERFTRLDAELNQINQKLSMMYIGINQLDNKLDKTVIEGFNQKSELRFNAISTYLDKYTKFLAEPGPNGKVYPTLTSLVAAYGGVDNAMKNSRFKAMVEDLANSSQTFITNYKDLDVGLKNVIGNLNNICELSTAPAGDIITTRLWCNYQIADIYTRNKFAAQAVEGFYKDYITALGNSAPVNMTPLYAQEIRATDSNIEQISPKVIMYDPLKGLNTDLVNNIKNISACNVNGDVQITGWFITGSATKPYIVTECRGDSSVQVKAKYYYQQSSGSAVDSSVINVLGVLVPSRFFGGDWANSGKFNWTNLVSQTSLVSFSSEHEADSSSASHDYTFDSGSFFAVNNQNALDPSIIKPSSNSIFPHTSITTVSRNGKNLNRYLFVQQPNGQLKTSFTLADFWNNRRDVSSNSGSSKDYLTYMRIVDTDKYAHVWATRTVMYRSLEMISYIKYNTKFYYKMALQCMTNECSVGDLADGSTMSLDFDKTAQSKVTVSVKGSKFQVQ